ncbi:MAG: two pore domain potassium channel family protein [Gammaproteobacteria bacterium]|nr:two pore domain potassium channel family protein [Gammaproteobacteria bacterium]
MLLYKIIRTIRKHLSEVTWLSIAVLILLHAALSWLLLLLAGESSLTSPESFLYYYVVTTSTVGFGDLSPETYYGKLVVALIQIPLGLALFGALLGKLGQSVSKIMRQIMTGEKDFSDYGDHILIFGWHPIRTPKIVSHILGDTKRQGRKIVLCVTEEMEHPMPDIPLVEFAKLTTFTDNSELTRVAAQRADKIIVDGDNDDQSFTCALKLSSMVADDCHISVYFTDETKVEMLNKYTTNVECNSSKTAEILVRAMQDPGFSRLQDEMMSTLKGNTQFSTEIPKSAPDIQFEAMFLYFKQVHNVTLLAVAEDRIGKTMYLNPDKTFTVKAGFILHYIGKERLTAEEVNWAAISSQH